MPDWSVRNIKCEGCARSIRRRLSAMDGVSQVRVDVAQGVVSFTADEALWDRVAQGLVKLGYVRTEDVTHSLPLAAVRSMASCLVGRVNFEEDDALQH